MNKPILKDMIQNEILATSIICAIVGKHIIRKSEELWRVILAGFIYELFSINRSAIQ